MTPPRRNANPDSSLFIVIPVVIVSLMCLFPILMNDLISLTTNPDNMPSSMCFPPPAWAIAIMFVRELIFVVAFVVSILILSHLIREKKFWRSLLIWGIPVITFTALVILSTMALPTPLQETPVCTGPANQPQFGYPFAWVMTPGQWTTYVDPYGFEFYSFSTYYLIVNIIFLANLAICIIGAIAQTRNTRTEQSA